MMLIDGRFKVIGPATCGGFSVVYLAEDTFAAGKCVMVKRLRESSCSDTATWLANHFLNEARALARIDHPNVVKLIAYGTAEDGQPYLAMEYVVGRPLREAIDPERGLGDFESVAVALRDLGSAISAGNDAGVYHRDLKPENILLERVADGTERVKVIDFGLATVRETLDEKTKATLAAGTIHYMAPEQIHGRPSRATDIYALGVVAYEMVTGRRPFNPDRTPVTAAMVQLFEMQREGVRVKPKDLRPSLSDAAQEAILKALSFAPEKRFARADELGDALYKALSAREATELYPVPKRLLPANFRRPLLAAGAVMLAFVLAAAISLYLRRSHPEPVQPSEAARAFAYSFLVGDCDAKGRPIGPLIQMAGKEAASFKTGEGVRIKLTPEQDGFFYMINKTPKPRRDSLPQFIFLYPSTAVDGGSARVDAGRPIEYPKQRMLFFSGATGNDTVYLVFSKLPVDALEAAKGVADEQRLGRIDDADQTRAIQEFLDAHADANKDVTSDTKTEMETTVRATDETIIQEVVFAHR
jgi:serine/threonine protein kinase